MTNPTQAQFQEVILRINELRGKQMRGEQLTMEEMREAVKLIRNGRMASAAPTAGTRARKTAAAQKPSGDDLLSQLEGL